MASALNEDNKSNTELILRFKRLNSVKQSITMT